MDRNGTKKKYKGRGQTELRKKTKNMAKLHQYLSRKETRLYTLLKNFLLNIRKSNSQKDNKKSLAET